MQYYLYPNFKIFIQIEKSKFSKKSYKKNKKKHYSKEAVFLHRYHPLLPPPLTCISSFQLLTASSVSILVKETVRLSLKNLWHASLRVSRPWRASSMEAFSNTSNSLSGSTGTTQRWRWIISSNLLGQQAELQGGATHSWRGQLAQAQTKFWLKLL